MRFSRYPSLQSIVDKNCCCTMTQQWRAVTVAILSFSWSHSEVVVGHNLCSYILHRFPILCLGDNRNSKFDGYKVEEEEKKTFCSFFTSRSPTFGKCREQHPKFSFRCDGNISPDDGGGAQPGRWIHFKSVRRCPNNWKLLINLFIRNHGISRNLDECMYVCLPWLSICHPPTHAPWIRARSG